MALLITLLFILLHLIVTPPSDKNKSRPKSLSPFSQMRIYSSGNLVICFWSRGEGETWKSWAFFLLLMLLHTEGT